MKHVVNNHQGEVRVWSQLGKGSTFTIRLRQAPGGAVLEGEVEAVEPEMATGSFAPRPAEYLATDEIPIVTAQAEPITTEEKGE